MECTILQEPGRAALHPAIPGRYGVSRLVFPPSFLGLFATASILLCPVTFGGAGRVNRAPGTALREPSHGDAAAGANVAIVPQSPPSSLCREQQQVRLTYPPFLPTATCSPGVSIPPPTPIPGSEGPLFTSAAEHFVAITEVVHENNAFQLAVKNVSY